MALTVSSDIMLLPVGDIDRDEAGRIGLFYPAKAEALAALIATNGQTTPIWVRKTGNRAKTLWKLVAGLHRLRACEALDIKVFAVEFTGTDDELRAYQASENVDRRELAPLERAMFVNAVVEATRSFVLKNFGVESDKALAAKAKAAKTQFGEFDLADADADAAGDNLSRAYGWADEAAAACGLGVRDLQRSLRIYRCIIGGNRDLIDAFKDHPVAQTADALLKIAAIKDHAVRRKVIETLIAGPKDLAYALQAHGLALPPAETNPYAKFTSQITGGWARLGLADQRAFVPQFVADMKPSIRQLLREELDKQLDSAGAK